MNIPNKKMSGSCKQTTKAFITSYKNDTLSSLVVQSYDGSRHPLEIHHYKHRCVSYP